MARHNCSGGLFCLLVVVVGLASVACAQRCQKPIAIPQQAQSQVMSIEEPVPLLEPAQGTTRLAPVSRGFALLRSIPGPVGIVTFVGRARSGKSFTLNRIMGLGNGAGTAGGASGFGVGHTVATKTRGAELWGVPFAGNNGTTIFVLDTEGLGAAPSSYDKALLLFASLVSSRIVYHLSEYVYLEDVTRLYTIVNLVRLYQRKSMQTVDLPPLTWLVQRFTLQDAAVIGDNAHIKFENEWQRGERLLQHFLTEQSNPSGNAIIAEFNETARAVRTEFGSSQLSALFVPPAVQDTSLFAQLPWTDPFKLDARYNDAICALRNLLFEQTPAKRIGHDGPPLTGPELADFAEAILPAINEGAGAFLGDRVLEGATRQLVAACLAAYEADMASDKLKLPIEEDQLRDVHLGTKAMAISRFDTEMIGEAASPIRTAHRTELQQAIERVFDGVLSENALKSAERCEAVVSATVSALRSRDFAGNVKLFDFEATAAVANATTAQYAPGPKGGDKCASRLRREVRLLRETVAAVTLPARVIVIAKIGASVLIMALLFKYPAQWFGLPNVVLHITDAASAGGLILCVLSLWSLDERAPISATTLAMIADTIQWSVTYVVDNWKISVPVAICLLLLLLLLRPKRPSSAASRLLKAQAGHTALRRNYPAVICVDNSPNVEHLRKTTTFLCSTSWCTPTLAVGTWRALGLSFMPHTSSFTLCVVGKRETTSADTCQQWLIAAAQRLTEHPPQYRDISVAWDDVHVAVFCTKSLQLLSGIDPSGRYALNLLLGLFPSKSL